MIFADTTPGSVRISSSARLIGSTLPARLFKFNLLAGVCGRETGDQYCRHVVITQAIFGGFPPRKHFIHEGLRRSHDMVADMSVSYHRDACFIAARLLTMIRANGNSAAEDGLLVVSKEASHRRQFAPTWTERSGGQVPGARNMGGFTYGEPCDNWKDRSSHPNDASVFPKRTKKENPLEMLNGW